MRAQLEAGLRSFFETRHFVETRTPILVPCPGMETHIRPFALPEGYLQTSPEFAMKRLLVGGLERLYQMATVFRKEPPSPCHLPEFTLLEWYRAGGTEEALLEEVEELICFLAQRLLGVTSLVFQGKKISLDRPWPRWTMRSLFQQYVGIDLADPASLEPACRRLGWWPSNHSEDLLVPEWDDLFFLLWLNEIEPRLPKDRAFFITRYPPSQAALAVVVEEEGLLWAKRFECYLGGLEIGNAFEELTDPKEQRRRFLADMALREKIYGSSFPPTPLDEDFLSALEEGMPPSVGIAMGVDRLVMLFANEPDIHRTVWLSSGEFPYAIPHS